MPRTASRLWLLALASCLLLSAPSSAFAYLDPGTGSFLFQAVAAGVISALFVIKAYWRRLRDKFTGRRGDDAKGDGDS